VTTRSSRACSTTRYAAKSYIALIDRAGSFIVESEEEVETLVSNLPPDIRLALPQLTKDIKEYVLYPP
jgi:hypothetical protein